MDNQRPIKEEINMRYTREEYQQHLQKLLPESDFTLNYYTKETEPCSITCHKCGRTYEFTQARNLLARADRKCKNVCRKCENNVLTEAQRIAESKANYKLAQKKTIIPMEEIKAWGSPKKMLWKCLKCNHTFLRSTQLMFVKNVMSCPWCESHPFEYDEKTLKEKTKNMYGDEYTILKIAPHTQERQSRRITVCHNKCGFKYSTNLYNFLKGCGCPRCRESKGEYRVRKYLEKHNFKYIEQYQINTEGSYLYIDFYLEENGKKYAIEYNGIQHYKPIGFFEGEEGLKAQQICDEKKKRYCLNNNIDLIVIPYDDESLINSEKLAQRLSGQVTE